MEGQERPKAVATIFVLIHSNRGYPDVAAQGGYNVERWGVEVFAVGGTSASTPVFAAIVALVNDALLSKGRPVLGFLNPWIYGGKSTYLHAHSSS